MAIRECRNCGREKTVVGDGCCFVCYNAGKGLEGDKKVAALAAAKERIEGGGLRCGGSRQSKKAAKKPITAEEKSSKEMMTSLRDGEPSPRPIEHPPNNHVIPLTICLEFEIGIRLTSLSG